MAFSSSKLSKWWVEGSQYRTNATRPNQKLYIQFPQTRDIDDIMTKGKAVMDDIKKRYMVDIKSTMVGGERLILVSGNAFTKLVEAAERLHTMIRNQAQPDTCLVAQPATPLLPDLVVDMQSTQTSGVMPASGVLTASKHLTGSDEKPKTVAGSQILNSLPSYARDLQTAIVAIAERALHSGLSSLEVTFGHVQVPRPRNMATDRHINHHDFIKFAQRAGGRASLERRLSQEHEIKGLFNHLRERGDSRVSWTLCFPTSPDKIVEVELEIDDLTKLGQGRISPHTIKARQIPKGPASLTVVCSQRQYDWVLNATPGSVWCPPAHYASRIHLTGPVRQDALGEYPPLMVSGSLEMGVMLCCHYDIRINGTHWLRTSFIRTWDSADTLNRALRAVSLIAEIKLTGDTNVVATTNFAANPGKINHDVQQSGDWEFMYALEEAQNTLDSFSQNQCVLEVHAQK